MIKIPNNKTILAQNFVRDFQCIGKECEYHCCQGWVVNVEKPVFKDLKKRYSHLAGKRKLVSAIKRNKNPDSDWNYGRIQLDHNSICPFLTDENLCDIHSRFGSNKLSWVCKNFPRKLIEGINNIELSLSLGCPEATRLCLLNKDSTELINLPNEALSDMSGPLVDPSLPDVKQAAYLALRDDIRQVFMFLADAQQYPVAGRLFLMLYFANSVNEKFHASSDTYFYDKILQDAIENIANPDVHSTIVNSFLALEYDSSAFMIIMNTLLAYKTIQNPNLNKLVQKCLAEKGLTEEDAINLGAEDHDRILKLYSKRSDILEKHYKKQIEIFLGNYVKHYLFYKSYTSFPSLISYLRNLLIHINVIKFLFILHPSLSFIVDGDNSLISEDIAQEALDKAIVESVTLSVRAFDHQNQKVAEVFHNVLDKHNFGSIEELAMLARV